MRLPSYQQLSKEQDSIYNLPLDGRHLVIGPPGSGKTVMALYRAEMLSKVQRKPKLLMYSRLLSQYTSSASSQLRVAGTVETFYEWFGRFFQRQYRRWPPMVDRWEHDYAEALEIIAVAPPAAGSLADLIIDEGQDLPKEFYMLTRHMARNVVVFADENQRITETQSTVEEIRVAAALSGAVTLTRNYRNTKEIAALAARFYTGLKSGIPEPPSRSGEVPVMRSYKHLTATVDAIRNFENNNPELSIGVFTSRKWLQKKVANRLAGRTVNPVQTYIGGRGAEAVPVGFDDPGIVVVNYPSTKGLEFDAVFIPELQTNTLALGDPTLRMLLYVMISRAREQLEISWSGPDEPPIAALFPRDLMEWR